MRSLEAPLERALRWLRSKQSAKGAWSDFWTPSGVSDEWVTAYAGAAVASSRSEAAKTSAQMAWRYLLRRRRGEGGWGYSARVPVDADSTVWALILADRLAEAESPAASAAMQVLERAAQSGRFSTYASAATVQSYMGLASETDFSGWMQECSSVTGAAAQLTVLRESLQRKVLSAQRSDGSWQSYWWFEDAYATAVCVGALARSPVENTEPIQRACHWARHRAAESHDRTSFELSLLLLVLAYDVTTVNPLSSCAAELLSRQHQDGHWTGCARLRIPSPQIIDPDSVETWERWWGEGSPFNIFSVDQRSVFTTATAFFAVSTAAHRLSGLAAYAR